jgi:hypothetical protein
MRTKVLISSSRENGSRAPLDQFFPGPLQLFEGRGTVPGISPGQPRKGAPQTGRGTGEAFFEPRAKRFLIQAMAFLIAQFFKRRIDASFDGPLPQDLRAEGMNGANGGFFQALERVFERGLPEALLIEFFAQAQFQLSGCFMRERHRGDFIDGGFLFAENRDNAPHQFGGLAGAC